MMIVRVAVEFVLVSLPRALPLLLALPVLGGCGASAHPATELPAPAVLAEGREPLAVFLTWQRDPTRTMTVDWHTEGETARPALHYRRAGERRWRSAAPESFPFPHSERTIHRVELTGLRPDATYEFRTGGPGEGWRSYSFRTMPARATRPIRFVAGGDVRHEVEWMERTGRQAAAYDPDFVMWGGDLAYADGLPERVGRWYEWFDAIRNTLVTPEGRVIPVLLAVGNHEVAGSYHFRVEGYEQGDEARGRIAPFFYRLFATPGQPGYAAIDFGDYLSVLLLDTDHTNPVAGEQTRWLERALRERQGRPHLFPLYHVPAYPSVRVFDGEVSRRVREHWVPLFERYGVRVAFENHDHVYKRTVPLRGGEPAADGADGVVYLGDGAWGVSVREIGRDWPEGERPWYLERGESVRHFILGELRGGERRFIMVDELGNVFDEYPAGSRTALGRPRFGVPAAAWSETRQLLEEAFLTPERLEDNIDSPAVWHGANGEAWLLTTAKSGDVLAVFDAATGAPLRRIGRRGDALGEFRRPNGIAVLEDLVFVVERDGRRVQALSLPDFRPLALFGQEVLRKPYGLTLFRGADGALELYVTDQYDIEDDTVGEGAAYGERVKHFRLHREGARLRPELMRSFGDTVGAGVLQKVESILADPAHDRLYIADEAALDIKIYDLAGRYTGRSFGAGLFRREPEGIALYTCGREGYLLATDQDVEANTFHVFDRLSLEHLGAFAGRTLASTDGIALTQRPVDGMQAGAFYAQHDNRAVGAIPWSRIAAALELRADCTPER